MGNNYLKISIVTPSFNSAKYIEDCIQSVLKQNYPNFEHIIIDGGSTDGTIDILKKYPHLKWISESDKGQSDALNKGFKMAKGDIIGWLNADDVYEHDVFQKVVEVFEKNLNIDVVYGEIVFTDSNLKVIRRKYDHTFDKNILLYSGCVIPSAATFFKKKIFSDGNKLDIKFKTSMDYEFFCKLATRGYKFLHIPDSFALFRKTGENYGKKYEDLWTSEILEIKRRYANLPFKDKPWFNKICFVADTIYRFKRLYLKYKTHGLIAIKNSNPSASDLKT